MKWFVKQHDFLSLLTILLINYHSDGFRPARDVVYTIFYSARHGRVLIIIFGVFLIFWSMVAVEATAFCYCKAIPSRLNTNKYTPLLHVNWKLIQHRTLNYMLIMFNWIKSNRSKRRFLRTNRISMQNGTQPAQAEGNFNSATLNDLLRIIKSLIVTSVPVN